MAVSIVACRPACRLAALVVFIVLGSAASVTRGDVLTFQQGANGYAGATDILLNADDPDTNLSAGKTLWVDFDGPLHSLVRFADIFGANAGQIPSGIDILSATLTIYVENAGLSRYPSRMLQDWDAATLTYNNAKLGGNTQPGIQGDGIEAILETDAFQSSAVGTYYDIDVTSVVQEWSDGAPNHGFFLRQTNTNALGFTSSDGDTIAQRPLLRVSFVPEPAALSLVALGALALLRRRV